MIFIAYRFVYLEDCEHIIEQTGMDQWMNTEQEQGEIGVKRCPKCRKILTSSVRYGQILKKKMKDVQAVRDRIFGHGNKLRTIQHKMSNELMMTGNYCIEYFRASLQQMICHNKMISSKKGEMRQTVLNKVCIMNV